MNNWSDKIIVMGIGLSDEDTNKIKEAIIDKANKDLEAK
jgi:hypothetical protein